MQQCASDAHPCVTLVCRGEAQFATQALTVTCFYRTWAGTLGRAEGKSQSRSEPASEREAWVRCVGDVQKTGESFITCLLPFASCRSTSTTLYYHLITIDRYTLLQPRARYSYATRISHSSLLRRSPGRLDPDSHSNLLIAWTLAKKRHRIASGPICARE